MSAHIKTWRERAEDEKGSWPAFANVPESLPWSDIARNMQKEIAELRTALQAQRGDGGHAAAQCDEATCPICAKHYPDIVAKARDKQHGEAKDERQADGNSVSKDATMAIWQHLATRTVLDTGTAMRCAKEIVKLLRPAAVGEGAQDAEDAPAPGFNNGLDNASWTKVSYQGFIYNFSAKLPLAQVISDLCEIVGESTPAPAMLTDEKIMAIVWDFQAGGQDGKFSFLKEDLPFFARALLAASGKE